MSVPPGVGDILTATSSTTYCSPPAPADPGEIRRLDPSGARALYPHGVGEPKTDSRASPALLLGLTVLVTVASAVQKLPCLRGRVDTDVLATRQCYSDAPIFYLGRGLAADVGWLGGLPPGYRDLEYPPLINVFIEASAKLTHLVMGLSSSELERRATLSADVLYRQPGVVAEERTFFLITCLGLLVAALVTVRTALRADWRVGDRVTWLMVTPVVVLTLSVNWDAVAIAFTALALHAGQRSRWVAFGVWVALGTAAKLFPLVLLGAAVIVLIQRRRWRPVLGATASFAVAWLLANAPLYLADRDAWSEFWLSNTDRPSSFGSAWMALRMIELPATADQLSVVLGVGMLATWLVGAALTWSGRIAPTLTELAVVFLLAFFVLGKVYSPQYSLWVVLGLLLVTRRRWLIGLVALAETWHYVETWLYIRGMTTPEVGIDKAYWSAIVLRIAAEAVVVVVVVRTAARRADSVRRSAESPESLESTLPITTVTR